MAVTEESLSVQALQRSPDAVISPSKFTSSYCICRGIKILSSGLIKLDASR